MSDEQNKNSKRRDNEIETENPSTIVPHLDTLDQGTEAFMQWMGSPDKKSLNSDNPIVLVKFINDVHTVLFDTSLSKEVEVKLSSGIPYCNHCKSDDCAHVGFTICVEQLGRHRHDGKEETIEEIVDS